MDNPYKRLSSINPQVEKGSRRIANDVFNALIKARLTGCEYQIALFVINQTWGYRKSFDDISITQFMGITGRSRQGVIETLHKLEAKKIVYIDRQVVNHSLPVNRYLFNKHYDTWTTLTSQPQFTTSEVKNILQTGKAGFTTSGQLSAHKVVKYSRPYNNNYTKETINRTKSAFADKIHKEMKTKKKLKLGETKIPEPNPF